jgi:TonB family protein
MLFRKKSAILVLFLSGALWAQTQISPSPTKDNGNQAATDTTPENPSALPDSTKLDPLKMEKAVYPIQAAQNGIQGQVVVAMHVSEAGDVEGVDVVSGDPILSEAAVSAAKKWKFKPFIRNGKPIKVTTKMPFDFYFNEKVMNKGASADGSATSDAKSTMKTASATTPTGANPSPTPDAPKLPQRVRVSQGVTEGLLIRQIAPVYPMQAKQNHVQGHVILGAVIGKDGRIQNLRAVAGPKELIPAAFGAVQQWRYKPYLLKGQPVEVETTIDINFQLSH